METYLFRNQQNEVAGKIVLYKRNLKLSKLKSFQSEFEVFKKLLKTEQFSKLDNLLNDALEKFSAYVESCPNNSEKLRFQNKYDGLNNLKRKIEVAKKEYNDNPQNQLAYNKLLNLYNSLRNLL